MSRQKQYFEQRKRQQQAPGLDNDSARNKHANYYEEPRSLDIVSLINLETITWQGYPNQANGKFKFTCMLAEVVFTFGMYRIV